MRMIGRITDETQTYRDAAFLIRDARTRAPTFVLYGFCFEHGLEQLTKDPAEQAAIRACARHILNSLLDREG